MTENPYRPPVADLNQPEGVRDIPREIEKKIRSAWIAGIVSSVLTAVVTLIAMNGFNAFGLTPWTFVDVVLMVALTFGIYKKSRVCAIAMLAYFVLSKIMMFSSSHSLSGLPLAVVFCTIYVRGVIGTWQYHAWNMRVVLDVV